ncbi:thiol:disulfide interchange protein [Alishewanella longhuensis]|uniref:Thiol:disulfide interchange protein n=1 Tax=Alishewanella longhuensis TaxID=1091037 RepID=A0ABQ3L017_9ALTE|nr:thiol:disulfide interchange protein DsbA/DsbL [Alishewanella longhuensis]GHG72453.1 thiol:disulfide interchange protein [Alishewanella longhuensis]
MRLLRLLMLTMASIFLLTACSKEPQAPELNVAQSASATPGRVFTEGQHYSMLPSPVTEPELKHYLTEFFWLGCPHCQNFEPLLKGYLQANPQVTLIRKHPALGERWAIDASVFYGLQLNGHGHLVEDLFALYRQTRIEKNALPDLNTINAFLRQHNIDPVTFSDLVKTEAVASAMEQANREMLDNRISGVPSLIVKGKYLVKGEQPADVKTAEDYYQLLDYLLSKE